MEPEAQEPESDDTPSRRHRRGGPPLITSEAFKQLAPEWAALHAQTPGASVFTHPAWTETWLRHWGKGLAPVFLSVRADEQLIGVAALTMERELARGLGDHNVCDYGSTLALPGFEPAVAAGLLEWLSEDLTPALELWGVEAGSPLAVAFESASPGMGWSFEQSHEANCPRAALPADFESYLAGLTKHDRHEVRRKLRNLAAAGTVGFESATTPEEIGAVFDHFLHLMRISRGDKQEFLTPQMDAYFRDLAQAFAALGMARLSTLLLDGKAVAMTFAFENAETVFLYNSGYDPAFAHQAVGLLSKVLAIRDAIERGKRTFDFLRGDETYKADLGGKPAPLVTLRMRQG